MAAITPSTPNGGITYRGAAAGDTIQPGVKLHVKNGGVGSIDVTVTAYGPCSHGFLHDLTFTVGAGADKFINPPDSARFVNPSDGLIHITYTGTTSVTVAAIAS